MYENTVSIIKHNDLHIKIILGICNCLYQRFYSKNGLPVQIFSNRKFGWLYWCFIVKLTLVLNKIFINFFMLQLSTLLTIMRIWEEMMMNLPLPYANIEATEMVLMKLTDMDLVLNIGMFLQRGLHLLSFLKYYSTIYQH